MAVKKRAASPLPQGLVRGLTQEQKYALASSLVAQRDVEVKAAAAGSVAAAAGAASGQEAEATGRAKLIAAIPWVIGGLAAVGLVMYLKKRRQ